MTKSSANHFRYRLFAGVFLFALLGVIIGALVTALFPLPVLLVVSLPFSALGLILLIRRRPNHRRRGCEADTVGTLSPDEVRVARSKLRGVK